MSGYLVDRLEVQSACRHPSSRVRSVGLEGGETLTVCCASRGRTGQRHQGEPPLCSRSGQHGPRVLAVRQSVFFLPTEEDAVVAAKDRLRRRDESRRIAATDPRLARELQIGRPDLPSDYDDGGLIDVNHVSEEYLRDVGALDAALASRIIEARPQVGGFDSLHDLEMVVGLDPRSLDEVADRLLFCR